MHNPDTDLNPKDIFYYQALLSGIDNVIISIDTNFIIQTWNTAAEKLYKLTSAQAIGKRITDVLKHEYINTTNEEVIKQLVRENKWKGLVKIANTNETTFLETTFTIVKNKDGKKIGYIGISRNVTEEINAKESLQNFTSVLSQLDESFLIVNKDYKITFLCPKGNVQSFLNTDFKAGDDAFKFMPGIYIDEVRKSYQRAFNGETVNYIAESNSGVRQVFNITYSPLKDDFGNIISVCVIIKDLTAQKEMELLQQREEAAQKGLYESRQLFEEFMENSPLLAWVVDAHGIMHYMNSGYLNSFEFPENVIGKNIFEIYSKKLAEEYQENNKKVIETNSTIETIEFGRHPTEVRTYKTIKFPIFYKEQKMIAGWAVDISDQIKDHEYLFQLNQQKNKLVSIIAHDLRAPLGINASFLRSLIRDFVTYSNEELFTSIELISKSSDKCYELVDELLTWGKGQLEKISFNPKMLDIQTEIFRITDSLWDQIHQKGITVETNFNFSGEIFADADMFAIVLRNFITNALKFSYANNVIKIETELIKDKVEITVKDNGTGMNAEMVKKLLEKLNYESAFGTKGEKGTGLGLIIAKDYIEKNGGKMGIESKEGAGSQFCFTVPLNNQNNL